MSRACVKSAQDISPRPCKLLRFGDRGLPEDLVKALVVPDRIKLTEHLLSRYANANLRAVIPTNLDIVLVHYLAGFYAEVTDNPLGFLAGCQGLYICQDHIWMPRRDATEVLRTLKEQCDLDVSEAILLPLGRIRYWTYVHESLHVIFNHLTPEQREAIIESARRSYASVFDMEGSIPFTLNLETSYDDYTWDGLTPRSRLRLVDELIACSFTHSSMNCPSKRPFPAGFRETLRDIGYIPTGME